jgi:DNA-binding ferritin-like protein
MTQKTHTKKIRKTDKRGPRKSRVLRGSARKTNIPNSKSNIKINDAKKLKIVKFFIEILNNVKLYHWRTQSYAQHKATDELYEKLNKDIDSFVEVMLGKDESRIKHLEKEVIVLDFSNKKEFKDNIFKFREFLIEMNYHFDKERDSDLLSIRDDLLVDVNQFLYLLTFDK